MNLDTIKSAAVNRWDEIILRVTGQAIDTSGKHGSCPKCGGSDRFRVFKDFDETGGVICNQCGKFADGIAVIQWLNGCGFQGAGKAIAEYLGIDASEKKKQPFRKPIDCIIPLSGSQRLPFAQDFCKAKSGIKIESLMRARWCAAKWPRYAPSEYRHDVLAFVSFDLPGMDEHSYILYRRNGAKFPAMKSVGERKTHILPGRSSGSQDGIAIVGTPDEFTAARTCYKCEGIPDALALAPLLDAHSIAVSNLCGAGSFNADWKESFERFEKVVIVGDNDPSGVGRIEATKVAGVLL